MGGGLWGVAGRVGGFGRRWLAGWRAGRKGGVLAGSLNPRFKDQGTDPEYVECCVARRVECWLVGFAVCQVHGDGAAGCRVRGGSGHACFCLCAVGLALPVGWLLGARRFLRRMLLSPTAYRCCHIQHSPLYISASLS